MGGLHDSGTRLSRAFTAARCPSPASEPSQVGNVTSGRRSEHAGVLATELRRALIADLKRGRFDIDRGPVVADGRRIVSASDRTEENRHGL